MLAVKLNTICSCSVKWTFIWTFKWTFVLINSKKKPYASFLNVHDAFYLRHNSFTLRNPVPDFSTSLLLNKISRMSLLRLYEERFFEIKSYGVKSSGKVPGL